MDSATFAGRVERREQRREAFEPGREIRIGDPVREPDRPRHVEELARHHVDSRFVSAAIRERFAGNAVGQHHEAADADSGRHPAHVRVAREERVDALAAAARVLRERRAVRIECVRVREHAIRQPLARDAAASEQQVVRFGDPVDAIRRGGDPTDAQSAETVRLRQTRCHDDVLAELRRTRDPLGARELAVDLVDDERDIRDPARLHERAHRGVVERGPGRVVRIRHDAEFAVREAVRDLKWIEPPPVRFEARQRDDLAAERAHRVLERRIRRHLDRDAHPRRHERREHEQVRAGRTRRDDQPVRPDADVVREPMQQRLDAAPIRPVGGHLREVDPPPGPIPVHRQSARAEVVVEVVRVAGLDPFDIRVADRGLGAFIRSFSVLPDGEATDPSPTGTPPTADPRCERSHR